MKKFLTTFMLKEAAIMNFGINTIKANRIMNIL